MSDKVFIDTNIWVYAKIEENDSEKHKQAGLFLKELQNRIFISTQVLIEFYNVLSKNKIPDSEIQNAIQQMLPYLQLHTITLRTITESWRIRSIYGFSIFDSLIIASAIETECGVLYTGDLQHNQLIEGQLRVINPFIR